MKLIVLSFLLAVAWLANPVAAEDVKTVRTEDVGLSSPRLEKVSDFIRGHIEEKKMAGAVVLIARHGKIAYLESFGQADTGKPMLVMPLTRMFHKLTRALAGLLFRMEILFGRAYE